MTYEPMTTTLNKIKTHSPCYDGWKQLLTYLGKTKADDETLSLETILKSNGLKDAAWCLKAVEGYDKQIRLFSCRCAEMVLPIFEKQYPDDDRPRRSVELGIKALKEPTEENVAAAAADAAKDAARAAAGVVCVAAWRAAWAAWAAAAADAADAAAAAADAAAAALGDKETRNKLETEFCLLISLAGEYEVQ